MRLCRSVLRINYLGKILEFVPRKTVATSAYLYAR